MFVEEFDYKLEHHVLLLDRFDQCFEYVNDLLAGFTRLRESSTLLQNFTVVVIISGEDPKEIVTLSNPHVYFKVYNESKLSVSCKRADCANLISMMFLMIQRKV